MRTWDMDGGWGRGGVGWGLTKAEGIRHKQKQAGLMSTPGVILLKALTANADNTSTTPVLRVVCNSKDKAWEKPPQILNHFLSSGLMVLHLPPKI